MHAAGQNNNMFLEIQIEDVGTLMNNVADSVTRSLTESISAASKARTPAGTGPRPYVLTPGQPDWVAMTSEVVQQVRTIWCIVFHASIASLLLPHT
jgi:hypothetical protein